MNPKFENRLQCGGSCIGSYTTLQRGLRFVGLAKKQVV